MMSTRTSAAMFHTFTMPTCTSYLQLCRWEPQPLEVQCRVSSIIDLHRAHPGAALYRGVAGLRHSVLLWCHRLPCALRPRLCQVALALPPPSGYSVCDTSERSRFSYPTLLDGRALRRNACATPRLPPAHALLSRTYGKCPRNAEPAARHISCPDPIGKEVCRWCAIDQEIHQA